MYRTWCPLPSIPLQGRRKKEGSFRRPRRHRRFLHQSHHSQLSSERASPNIGWPKSSVVVVYFKGISVGGGGGDLKDRKGEREARGSKVSRSA